MSFIVPAIVLIALFVMYTKIKMPLLITKIKMRRLDWKTVSRSELPPDLATLFGSTQQALSQLRFEYIETRQTQPTLLHDVREVVFSEVYWNEFAEATAIVSLASPASNQVIRVDFCTLFESGHLLYTVNRHLCFEIPFSLDWVIVQDGYVDNLTDQWLFHWNKQMELFAHQSTIADIQENLNKIELMNNLEARRAIGKNEISYDQTLKAYKMTVLQAHRFLKGLKVRMQEVSTLIVQPYQHQPALDARAVCAFERDEMATVFALQKVPLSNSFKILGLLVTAVITAVFWYKQDSWIMLVALMLVLCVHELGHWLAMKIFKYQNLSVFFLPFLGAATTGYKSNAALWQQAVVYLAGPAFGLLIAIFAYWGVDWSRSIPLMGEFLRTFFILSVVVNIFNLLPIGFLDGGRLFQLIILNNFPSARAVFSAIGLLIIAYFGYVTDQWWLIALMGFFLVGVPQSLRIAAFIKEINRENPHISNENQALEIAVRNVYNIPNTHFESRLTLVGQVYPILAQGQASWLVRLLLIVAYVGVILSPLLVIGHVFKPVLIHWLSVS